MQCNPFNSPATCSLATNSLPIYVVRLTVLLLVLTLAACASTKKDEAERLRETERELYDAAQRGLRTQQWSIAIENLQKLEDNFPFGSYGEQAQLELIYAYYRNYDFAASIAAADRFIRLHPRHRNVDYAYYMKGLASFTDGSGLFERFLPTDMSQRDPGAARESFAYFNQLLALFPNSQYAPDAEKRMIHLRNLLARYEIHVANYYFKRGAYLAAVNRGRYVVENFQTTPAVPDGLAVMVQGYKLLGLQELQDHTLALLKENYPNHPALKDNGEFDFQFISSDEERSWLNRMTFGLFDKREPPGFDSREVFDPQFRER
ncbi:MAG: outer membrane protein assembly factor BamD [Cellvibrionaceae bacterium]